MSLTRRTRRTCRIHRMSRRASSELVGSDPTEHVLSFDGRCHSVDAVQRAVYRFSDRLSAEVRMRDEEIECRLFLDKGEDPESASATVAAFRREVVDQVLRERIRAETEPVRNLILAHVFSNTAVVEPD